MHEKRLSEIDWAALVTGRTFYPSPASWDDEVLYFLMLDRFSDGTEHGGFGDASGAPVPAAPGRTTPLFDAPRDAGKANRNAWFAAGRTWCGGTLAGLEDKLGYLKRLGVTAVWISPVFRQVTGSDSYHGYGIQDFLDVDPHFGTREALKDFVKKAHDLGLRVVLDIIFNHAGNVFAYPGDHEYRYCNGMQWMPQGFRRDAADHGSLPFDRANGGTTPPSHPDEAVWPAEFQDPDAWTRKGCITDWDAFPQYLDGDFFSLKDFHHGDGITDPGQAWDVLRRIDAYHVSPTLRQLADVYKFWIAYADLDGYRIDTVKHVEPGAVRYFTNVIREFAQSLGKENFSLIGEVTGGRDNAINIVNTTGLSAALGINDIPDKLEFLAKGWRNPGNPDTEDQEGYFDLFRNGLIESKPTHQWYGKHIVTMFDDHDQVGTDCKFRFCGQHADSERFLDVALALNLLTLGIPCLYYGTEQAFDGADPRGGKPAASDTFLRECMFGGPFGSRQSTGVHFFDESNAHYRFVSRLCALRREHIALRRGRQYLRQLSQDAQTFFYPALCGGVLHFAIAWSRIFNDAEYLCAVNTDVHNPVSVWATVDAATHKAGNVMHRLFASDPAVSPETVTVEAYNGTAIRITVPAGGCVIYT
jgi:glycosidase